MYCICSRGQPTRGRPPAWVLGEVLTTPHRKRDVTKLFTSPRTWTDHLVQSYFSMELVI